MTPSQAKDSRDSVAKFIYGRLFDWIVQRVNKSMSKASPNQKSIGILDIFGFEIFKQNSFEQLCINFTNEMLQQHFNQHTFKLEEDVYKKEGIRFSHVEFVDNKPMIDLIMKKPKGVLPLLDEEERLPSKSDAGFLQKLKTKQKSNEKFKVNIKKPTLFVIKHYAGPVKYDSIGFLEKNRDKLSPDLIDLLNSTAHPLMQVLFPSSDTKTSSSSKTSLGSQFIKQLKSLMMTLNATEPHYIRCVKPNEDKMPGKFVSRNCMEQLTYSGVFEAVSIRKQGFPFRLPYQKFVDHYKCINNSGNDAKETCLNIMNELKLDMTNVQMGHTQVFYRADEYKKLELIRGIKVMNIEINRNLQALVDKNVNSLSKEQREEHMYDLAKGVRQADEFRITTSIADQARRLLERFIEQRMDPDTKRELKDALRTVDQAALEKVIFKCNENGYRTEDYRACVQLLEQVVDCEAAMKRAREELDEDFLKRALAMAAEFNYRSGSQPTTQDLLDKVVSAQTQLQTAIASKDHNVLTSAVQFCQSFNFSIPLVKSASDLLARVLELRSQLTAAINSVTSAALTSAVAAAADLSYEDDLVYSAQVLAARVHRVETESLLAADTMDEAHIRAVVSASVEINFHTDYIDWFIRLVQGEHRDLLAAMYKRAVERSDHDRAIRLAVLQKDLSSAQDQKKTWNTHLSLRDPTEWASSRYKGLGGSIGCEERSKRMKTWQKETIHSALTVLSSDPAKQKVLKKLVKTAFLSIQVHMADSGKTDKAPADKLLAVLQSALAQPDIRLELYLHVFKMLTPGHTPETSVFPTAQGIEKVWEILALYLNVFPPPPSIEGYLDVLVRDPKYSVQSQKWRCAGLIRRIMYHGDSKTCPSAAQLADLPSFLRSQNLSKFDEVKVLNPSYTDLLTAYQPYVGAQAAQPEQKRRGHARVQSVNRAPTRPPPVKPAPVARNPWKAYRDESSGNDYYYNEDTGETTWTKPEGL